MAAAGGVAAALTPTRCRVTGALGEDAFDIVFSNSVGDIAILFDNPRNVMTERANGRCTLDWTVDGISGLFLFGRLSATRSLGSELASEFRGDYPFVDDSQGTATAEAYKPRGQLLGGIALAGAGAILALLPGGDQVRPTLDFQRRRFGVTQDRQLVEGTDQIPCRNTLEDSAWTLQALAEQRMARIRMGRGGSGQPGRPSQLRRGRVRVYRGTRFSPSAAIRPRGRRAASLPWRRTAPEDCHRQGAADAAAVAA